VYILYIYVKFNILLFHLKIIIIMKKLFLISSLLVTFVLLTGFDKTESSKKYKKLVGTWEYEAKEAPYEYQKGQFVFEISDGDLTGYAKIGMMGQVNMENILVDKKNVSFKCNVQGQYVDIDFVIKKKSFIGSAVSPGGAIPLTGIKLK